MDGRGSSVQNKARVLEAARTSVEVGKLVLKEPRGEKAWAVVMEGRVLGEVRDSQTQASGDQMT